MEIDEDLELPELPELPQMPQFPDDMNEIVAAARDNLIDLEKNGTFKIFERLAESINHQTIEINNKINEALKNLSTSILSQLGETVAKLIDGVADLKFPMPTEEEAEQLLESNKIWGQYGWTYMPTMPITMFNVPPKDLSEANKQAMRYCTDRKMEKLFTDLRKWELNQKDLDSAIFCYKNRQYKASALMLCSLIDGRVIQVRTDKDRPTGKGAVEYIKNKYNGDGEKILAVSMFVYNLFSYLETLFVRAGGFLDEPNTLNRHYISHGMNRRAVRKRDCVQLFLALNNVMQFFNYVYR